MREEIIMADAVLLIIMCTSIGSWAGIIGTMLGRKLDWVPVICWVAVLAPGLFVVTALAKAAPVASIPEERRISPVRNDVVDHRCFDVASFL